MSSRASRFCFLTEAFPKIVGKLYPFTPLSRGEAFLDRGTKFKNALFSPIEQPKCFTNNIGFAFEAATRNLLTDVRFEI